MAVFHQFLLYTEFQVDSLCYFSALERWMLTCVVSGGKPSIALCPVVGHVSLFFLWLLLGPSSSLLMFFDLIIMSLSVVLCVWMCMCVCGIYSGPWICRLSFSSNLESFLPLLLQKFPYTSLPLWGSSHMCVRLCGAVSRATKALPVFQSLFSSYCCFFKFTDLFFRNV